MVQLNMPGVWVLLRCVILFPWLIANVKCKGTFEVSLIKYNNPDGKDAGGQCCESILSFLCASNECDPIFDICLQDSPGHGCPLGHIDVGYTQNSDHITFGKVVGSNRIPNPMRFPFVRWTGMALIKVTISDEDKLQDGKGENDKIDYIQYVYTTAPDPNNTRTTVFHQTLTGSLVTMEMEFNARCDKDYYGNDCTIQCIPMSGRYDCDSTGNKVCHPGWKGPDCVINKNDCQDHLCENGATCIDHLNGYTCTCPPGFTGYNCELLITTSTSTTQTSTTSPPTLRTTTLRTTTLRTTSLRTTTAGTSGQPITVTVSTMPSSTSRAVTSQTTPTATVSSNCQLDVVLTTWGRVALDIGGHFNLTHFENLVLEALKHELNNSRDNIFLNVTEILNTTGPLRTIYLNGFDLRRGRVIDSRLLANISRTLCPPSIIQYQSGQPSKPKVKSGNPGPIIGGVIGALLALVGIGTLAFILVKRQNSKVIPGKDRTRSDPSTKEEALVDQSTTSEMNVSNGLTL